MTAAALAIGLLLALVAAPISAAEPFTLKDGDRVVFLGNTLIDQICNAIAAAG